MYSSRRHCSQLINSSLVLVQLANSLFYYSIDCVESTLLSNTIAKSEEKYSNRYEQEIERNVNKWDMLFSSYGHRLENWQTVVQ